MSAVGTVGALTLEELAPIIRKLHRTQPGLFTWIYAIQAGENGPVKIGVSRDPAMRLATLQRSNHAELRGIAAWRDLAQMEKVLHKAYAHVRIRGEWFQPTPELIEEVTHLGGDYEDWTKP